MSVFRQERWLRLVALALALTGTVGCATRSAPMLIPLASEQMPTREELVFRPWRVVVADSVDAEHAALQQEFAAALKQQMHRYGIQTIASDARTNAVLADMLRLQAAGGGDVDIRDPKYDILSADGVVTVTVTSVSVPQRNERSVWTDRDGVEHARFESAVQVSGYVTLARPRLGTMQTMRFARSTTTRSDHQPHRLAVNSLAMSAVRRAAAERRIVETIRTEFPLVGYVVGAGGGARLLKINRGRMHGVQDGRRWALLLDLQEPNQMGLELTAERVIGTARTVEVFDQFCIVKCNSGRTRDQAKLGMKARAEGFGFSVNPQEFWESVLELGAGLESLVR